MLTDVALISTRDSRAYAECLHCRAMLGVIPVAKLRNEHGAEAEGLIRREVEKLVADHECAGENSGG